MSLISLPHRVRTFTLHTLTVFALTILPTTMPAAYVDEIISKFEASDFRFSRTKTDLPFFQVGWIYNRHYSSTDFTHDKGILEGFSATENTTGIGAFMPAYIGQRDAVVIGADAAWDRIKPDGGPYADLTVTRITPFAGWARQVNDDNLVGAFVSPFFTQGDNGDQNWEVSGYAGVIGMHWFSDSFQLLYGGAFAYGLDQNSLLPYLGAMWIPNEKLSVGLIMPWPTITYSLRKNWIAQLGLSPGGASWADQRAGAKRTQAIVSWNLNASLGYQLKGPLWLVGSVGMSTLRNVTSNSGDLEIIFDADPAPVFTLAIQFRP